jgi:EAL domain-containing protein (putative c-di-GMP-specific phosphodiesterase class I)
MQVVAEWVDSEAIIQALAALGVDHAQGYALHRPEPAMMYRER